MNTSSSNDASNIDGEFNKILARKSAGKEMFAAKNYNEAIPQFETAIAEFEAKQMQIVELISECYNNISACNENLVNFISLFVIKWRENSSIKCCEFEFVFPQTVQIYKLILHSTAGN